MEKSKILSKPVCITLLLCAFVYGLALPFFWGNNPASELGTLSLLCEDRKGWFWLWGLLVSGANYLNAKYMHNKFGYKNKIYDVLGILSMISVGVVALTLGHSIDDWNPKRIAHWVATGIFIVFTMLSITLYFIINRKKEKSFGLLTVGMFVILATFVVIFVGVGKSALMEMIPIAMLQVYLFIINFTSLVKPQPIPEKASAISE